ncbi:hypothetical protein M9H77_28343 [Catharanthus roseus]|uniref:Uncharacterized protein n=1 Tax=Catharanthus roseus TaxID=4058 RepID=A0ACC0AGR7_CATRO|nr:hypothetical protein M9H77_28343 [Catharanthus roseus]
MVTRRFPPVNSSSYKKVPPTENHCPVYLQCRATEKSGKPRRGADKEYGKIDEKWSKQQSRNDCKRPIIGASKQRRRSRRGEEAAVTTSCRNRKRRREKRAEEDEQSQQSRREEKEQDR